MNKTKLSNKLKGYFNSLLEQNYGGDYSSVEVIKPTRALSKINKKAIKKIEGRSVWSFRPDLLGILNNSTERELILINRETKSIGLREIGELRIYAQITNAKRAFLISNKGISSEINVLLQDSAVEGNLLTYNKNNVLTLGRWNQDTNSIKQNSIIPIEERAFFKN